MSQIFGIDLGINLPSLLGGFTGSTVMIIIAVILMAISGVIVIYFILDNRNYNKKVIIWENLGGGKFEMAGRDKARLVKVGDAGEEILFLKYRRIYRSAYGRKMGKNTYWFAIGQDGYWYNIILGDLDAKMGILDIEPIDRDMRYMHVAIRKNIQERYRKVSFMEKYGIILMSGIFLLIMIGSLFFLIDQIGELMTQASSTVKSIQESNELIMKALSTVSQSCNGGSGIITVK